MSRNRLCNSPAPAFGGNDCSGIGPARETTQCNTHECPSRSHYALYCIVLYFGLFPVSFYNNEYTLIKTNMKQS